MVNTAMATVDRSHNAHVSTLSVNCFAVTAGMCQGFAVAVQSISCSGFNGWGKREAPLPSTGTWRKLPPSHGIGLSAAVRCDMVEGRDLLSTTCVVSGWEDHIIYSTHTARSTRPLLGARYGRPTQTHTLAYVPRSLISREVVNNQGLPALAQLLQHHDVFLVKANPSPCQREVVLRGARIGAPA